MTKAQNRPFPATFERWRKNPHGRQKGSVITRYNGVRGAFAEGEYMEIKILKGENVEVAGAPEVIAVLPIGHVVSSKGEFNVSAESLAAMKAEVRRKGVDLVVDYEHQTLKGVQAPAAGWVKDLFLKDGRICARVEWTPKAKEYLENREYRYLSPVVSVRKSDDLAVGLHSIALTNTPAIEGMDPIVNSETFSESEGGKQMEELWKRLAQMLGLEEDADGEEILAAVEQAVEAGKTLKEQAAAGGENAEKVVANKAVCELLDLKAGAPVEDVMAKIQALKAGNIGGVNVLAELKALKAEMAQKDADDAVVKALKAGKISAAQKDWAKSYALSDPKGFAVFVEKAPQVVPMGEFDFGTEKKELKQELDEAALKVCKQLGISEDDFEKYGKE